MKNVKKALAMLLSVVMVIALSACGSTPAPATSAPDNNTPADSNASEPAADSSGEEFDWEGKTYKLSFASFVMANTGAGQGISSGFDYISEKSDGHIVIDSYWNNLVEAGDLLQSVNDGAVDFIFTNQVYYPGTMPMTDLLAQKFFCEMPSGAGCDTIFRTAIDTMPEFQQEFEAMGSHLIDAIATAPNFFGCHKDFASQLKTPTDLSGKVVQASGNYATALQGVGAAPLNMPATDWYTNFERGIVDINYINWAAAHDFGLCDVVDSYVTFGTSGGLGVAPELVLMNLDTWNSLPEYVQNIIVEGLRYGNDKIREFDAEIENSIIAEEQEAGKLIAHVEEEDMQPWYDLAAVALEDWKKAASAAGYDADTAVERYQAIVNDYLATH